MGIEFTLAITLDYGRQKATRLREMAEGLLLDILHYVENLPGKAPRRW